jgi:hypothetical protein
MNVTYLDTFYLSTIILMMIYYFRSKIYLFIWVALLNFSMLVTNAIICSVFTRKVIVIIYVVSVMLVYICQYIHATSSKYSRKTDKINPFLGNKKMLPFFAWMVFNLVAKLIFKLVNSKG